MKIRMLETRLGVANAVGSRTLLYRGGQTYAMALPWQQALAAVFVAAGWAVSADPPAPLVPRGPARASSRKTRSRRDRSDPIT